MIELCYCISEDPFFESFSLSKSKTAAVLTPTIQKVEDEECQESDIFMEILVVFVNTKYLRNILVLDVKTCNPGF